MNRNTILVLCVLCLALTSLAAFAHPHDLPGDSPAPKPVLDQQAATEAWTKAMTPGKIHNFLGIKEGKWKIQGKMWTEPGADPIPSSMTAHVEMILGGRYLKEEVKGISMGMPFQGLGITGYDNVTGIVTSTWYDTMGTTTAVMSGHYTQPGEPMELSGSTVDVITGEEMSIRTVTTFVSDNESVFEYFSSPAGAKAETKVMELHYTRMY